MLTARDFHSMETAYKEGVDECGRNIRTIIEQAYQETICARTRGLLFNCEYDTCHRVMLKSSFYRESGAVNTPNSGFQEPEPYEVSTAFVMSPVKNTHLNLRPYHEKCRIIMVHMEDRSKPKGNFIDDVQPSILQHMDFDFGEMEWYRHIERDLAQYALTGVLGRVSRISENIGASLETKRDKK